MGDQPSSAMCWGLVPKVCPVTGSTEYDSLCRHSGGVTIDGEGTINTLFVLRRW